MWTLVLCRVFSKRSIDRTMGWKHVLAVLLMVAGITLTCLNDILSTDSGANGPRSAVTGMVTLCSRSIVWAVVACVMLCVYTSSEIRRQRDPKDPFYGWYVPTACLKLAVGRGYSSIPVKL